MSGIGEPDAERQDVSGIVARLHVQEIDEAANQQPTAHQQDHGDPEFGDHLELVDNAKNRTLIQTKLIEFGFADAQVKFVKAEAPADRARPPRTAVGPASLPAPDTPAPAEANAAEEKANPPQDKSKPEPVPFKKDDFRNDPLIQKALEIFKGQIVEVRA